MQKIVPFLWFDQQAEEAVKFYTSIFKKSKIGYGLSWQIVPSVMGQLLSDLDTDKSQRVMQAMLQMAKLDIQKLKQACANVPGGSSPAPSAKTKTKPKTIDAYLAGLNKHQRTALETLRHTIRSVAPRATECISYGLPAFRLDQRILVGFGATANHCAFYPMSGTTIAAHQEELKGYQTSKATIRFAADHPLPPALVRKLVKTRMAENGNPIA